MTRAEVDRNLLFGLLATRAGLVDREALSDALKAWDSDGSRGLAEVLDERGALPAGVRPALEELARRHVEAHGGDPARSLEAVDDWPTREAHVEFGPPDADANTAGASTNATEPDGRGRPEGPGSSGPRADRFRILRPHRQGGLGEVAVALDAELNREVALKRILDRHADDPTSRARFLLEAEITGGLEHPGIVPVYSLGLDAGGRPYYAMRFIRGDTLKDAIANHRGKGRPAGSGELEFRKLLRRFLDACNAIEYAHQRGILHRDLKPSNIMVGRYGETLVVDWGLAKSTGLAEPGPGPGPEEGILSPSHSSGSAETVPGATIGTPAYMSPEQADGDLERLGARSDVYSLGATLYTLLTGRPPYSGPDAASILDAARAGDPPPPRALDPTIDPALEAVCLKAMARAPEGRHASAAALAEEIERWMAGEPVLAYPEPIARRLARWARRHSSLVSGVGVFLVAVAVGLGLVAWLVARHNRRLEVARIEARTAGTMAYRAVRTMLTDVAADDLQNVPRMELLRLQLAERALNLYSDFIKDHPDDPEFGLEYARIEEQVASLYRMTGKFDLARVEYQNGIAILRGLLGRDPWAPDVLNDLAYTEDQFAEMIKMAGGSDAEAEPHYREAVRVAEGVWGRHRDDPKHAQVLAVASNDLANMLKDAGRFEEAEPLFARGLEAARVHRASLPKDPDPAKFDLTWVILPMAQTIRGATLAGLGRGRDAVAQLDEAIDGLRALALAFPESNDIQYSLANALREIGDAEALNRARLPEALRAYDEAVGLFAPLPEKYPQVAFYHDFLILLRGDRGAIRLADGQVEPAREDLAFADARLAHRLRAGEAPPDSIRQAAKVKASLARLADRDGLREKARALAGEAVALQEQVVAIESRRPADRELLDRHRALRDELAGNGL